MLQEIRIIGRSGDHVLFGTEDDRSVAVRTTDDHVFAVQPTAAVSMASWVPCDPSDVRADTWSAAHDALYAEHALSVETKTNLKRQFSVPRAVRETVRAALARRTADGSPAEVSPATEEMARALAENAAVSYTAVRHINRVLSTADSVSALTAAAKSPTAGKQSFVPPKEVQKAAGRALELIKEGRSGQGFTDTGRARAAQLARGESVSRQTIKRMHAYFTRHAGDRKPDWSAKGKESPGYTAWQAWGGDAGAAWARKMVKSFQAETSVTATAGVLDLWGGAAAKRWTDGILLKSGAVVPLALAIPLAAAAEQPLGPPADGTGADAAADIAVGPDSAHVFVPTPDDPDRCDVCHSALTTFAHMSTDEELESATGSNTDAVGGGEPAEPLVAASAGRPGLVDADTFFQALHTNEAWQVPDFFFKMHVRPDLMPSAVLEVYAQVAPETWLVWNPRAMSWSDTAEPAFEDGDMFPTDDDSAYAAAVVLSSETREGATGVPVADVNELEWRAVSEASPTLPPIDGSALTEAELAAIRFCVVFAPEPRTEAESVHAERGPELSVVGLYLRGGDDACYEWNPYLVEWSPHPVNACPDDCTEVDADSAKDIARRLSTAARDDAHEDSPTLDHGYPGWTQDAVRGRGRDGEDVPVWEEAGQRTLLRAEFDAAFGRAFWLAGTPGEASPAKGSSDAVFAARVDAVTATLVASDGYTPEERSKNASAQFRDANGRFASRGDVMHIKGKAESGKVSGYDPKSDRVLIEYADGSTESVARTSLVRLGTGQEDGSNPQSKPYDVSGIRAKPRATKTTPKGLLPSVMQPMDAPALQKVTSDYQKFIDEERKRRLKRFQVLDPTTTDVTPLYLAEVDALDKQAVMELIALVPRSKNTTDLAAYVRRAGGWELDEKYLMRIKSTTPPPLITLDQATYKQVLEQVDSFYRNQKTAEETVTAALRALHVAAATPWTEDGELREALRPTGALRAAGMPGMADTPADVAAARRLRRYWKYGAGAAKIRWNTPGDWGRCYKHLSKYMGVRAKGYCQLLHKEVTGVYTGSRLNPGRKRGLRADGSAYLLALPDAVLASRGQVQPGDLTVLAELGVPTLSERSTLRYRRAGHMLRVGEKFLVDGGDGVYTVTVLDPARAFGWSGEAAILLGRDSGKTELLQEASL